MKKNTKTKRESKQCRDETLKEQKKKNGRGVSHLLPSSASASKSNEEGGVNAKKVVQGKQGVPGPPPRSQRKFPSLENKEEDDTLLTCDCRHGHGGTPNEGAKVHVPPNPGFKTG